MRPYRSLWIISVFIYFNVLLRVFKVCLVSFLTSWVFMVPYRFLFFFTNSTGFLWVLICCFSSEWILKGSYGSL